MKLKRIVNGLREIFDEELWCSGGMENIYFLKSSDSPEKDAIKLTYLRVVSANISL